MGLNDWLNKNADDLLETTKNITKNHEDSDELFQSVVLQLLEKPDKIQQIPDNEKKYFFIKVIKNNWFSNTSPYHYQERKYKSYHFLSDEIPDEEHIPYSEDGPSMEWVREQLQDFDWFKRDIFLLWIEVGTMVQVHKETTIPLNSVGTYIKQIKQELINRWNKKLKDEL
jgi:DNA-directed RNA polymerase specialized sigma24 family protein